jgi:hypothetical protein
MNLPVYELKINDSLQDDSEVSYVALVDEPAIQKDFLMFRNEFVEHFQKNINERFQVMDEEKRIISGPLMLADMLIYRNNEKFGEHYVKFTADTIKDIAIKFAKRKYQSNVNIMHDQPVDGVIMFESWLTDKERGILPMKGFEDVADGSWFGSFYVENEAVWQSVKAGEFKGFSVEGLFDYEAPKSYEEEMLAQIRAILYS